MEVEVHGASGAVLVDPQAIKAADAIIIAADATVAERDWFAGRPQAEMRLRKAVDHPEAIVEKAEAAARSGVVPEEVGEGEDLDEVVPVGGGSAGAEVRRWLMTGVS